MTNTIQVRRGANASLPVLNAGELGFSTDSHQVYIGDGATNHEIASTPQITKLNGIADNANNYSHPSAPPCQAATSSVDGHATTTQISKLDGIETGATADQTKADIDALGINAGQVGGCDAGTTRDDVWKIPSVGNGSIFVFDGDWLRVDALAPGETDYQLTSQGTGGGLYWAAPYSHPSAPACQAATASVDGHATTTQISKLDGIEDGADVTDATNVNAAGAVMNLDFGIQHLLFSDDTGTVDPVSLATLMSYLSSQAPSEFSFNTQQVGGIVDPTSAQQAATKNYCDTNFNNYSHPSAPPCQEATSSVAGHATTKQIEKLDAIETGATADQTKADIDALGINADQVDGCDAGISPSNVLKLATGFDGGEIYYGSTSNILTLLAGGTSGWQLTTYGVGANPAWAASADLIFSDTHCPKCGKKFEEGDNLVLHVIGHNEVGDTLTIPIHKECAEAPKKTVTIKRKVFEDQYILDELAGEAKVQRVQKMQEKTVTKHKLKDGYVLDNRTGKAHKIDKNGKRGKTEYNLADALETAKETIKEVKYHDVEYEL